MHIVLTEKAISKLADARIFTSDSGKSRFSAGDTIVTHPKATMGRYTSVLGGLTFPTMGSFSYTQSQLPPEMGIGRYCSIAPGVGIIGGNHPTQYVTTSSFSYDINMAMFGRCLDDDAITDFPTYGITLSRAGRHDLPVIENDVWIGGSVVLSRGITLGTGCIVAAQSVVTKSVPPYAIVGGNPARTIKMRFPDELVNRLLTSEWWNYKFSQFGPLDYNDPESFVKKIEIGVSKGDLRPFSQDYLLADLLTS